MAVARSVLIADDDQDTCEALAQALSDEGFDASCVGDGRAVMEALRTKRAPSVVLLDMLLPGEMDGWDVLKAKAADPRIAAIPVIVMSGYARLPDAIGGVVAVLRKPFEWEELLRALEQSRTKPRAVRPTL